MSELKLYLGPDQRFWVGEVLSLGQDCSLRGLFGAGFCVLTASHLSYLLRVGHHEPSLYAFRCFLTGMAGRGVGRGCPDGNPSAPACSLVPDQSAVPWVHAVEFQARHCSCVSASKKPQIEFSRDPCCTSGAPSLPPKQEDGFQSGKSLGTLSYLLTHVRPS